MTTLPLRWCVPTGEALPVDLAREWLARYPNIPLMNAYGPTECSDDVTHHIIRAGDELAVMSIGRPVQNTRMYVMRDGLALGIMEIGELHVGGVGVGRGYLNHPTLTAEKFVPDPFATIPGARLYRTGDLGRWRADGTLEFLGRIDHQVKVRGFRIELGDIESALLADSTVHESIVLAREDTPGDQRLVAYVTAKSGTTIDLNTLRTALTEALPVYMVPQAILVLDALPLTPNGKVDRKALPAPAASDLRTEVAGEYVAPRSPLEEMLAELFAKTLKVERVSITDDFFALGGQSLLVMRIVATIRNLLKKEVRVRDFFEGPTVEKLALRLSKVDGVATPPLLRGDEAPGSVISFGQDLLLHWEAVREPSVVWTIGRAIELEGKVDVPLLLEAIRLTVERQESLRQVFDTRVPGFAPKLLEPEELKVERIDANGWAPEKITAFINAVTSQTFKFDGSPLVRFQLLDRGSENLILVMGFHSIVQDPTTSTIIISDLAAHYAALLGKRPPLGPLPIRYADFAMWERRWFLEGGGKADIATARKRLVGVVPHDFRHGKNDVVTGTKPIGARFRLDPEASARFEAGRLAESVTSFVAIATIVGVALSRWTQSDDVVLVCPVNLRNLRPEIATVCGRFANNVPVAFSVAGNPTWRELLGRARAAILDAFSYEWVPLALALDAPAPLAHPLGRVILNFIPPRGAPGPAPTAGDVTFVERPVPAPSGARGDITFGASAVGGIGGNVVGAADRFDQATIEQQAKNLRELFEQFEPAQRILR